MTQLNAVEVLGIVFLTVILITVVWVVYQSLFKTEHKDGGIVPDPNPWIEHPGEIIIHKPTIETQYGRDLLKTSTDIFLKINDGGDPLLKVDSAIECAVYLLSEVGGECSKIDKQKHEESEKRSMELIKEARWNKPT